MGATFTRSLRVLVAEDEELAALVIEEVLTGEGHLVTLAPDGAAALDRALQAQAAQQEFDVLVTDLAMPRMTGMELIDQLRLSHPNLPVVVMTGFLSPEHAAELSNQAYPPLALLHKPFRIDSLLAALAGVGPRLIFNAAR